MILGFAGAGLVGGIAVNHIVEQLEMEKIAHVRSRFIPPAVIFSEGQLQYPFRIYASADRKLCAVLCELPLRSDGFYPISQILLDWAEHQGVSELIILEGFATRKPPKKRKTFFVAEF
jgi:uncharacterized protein